MGLGGSKSGDDTDQSPKRQPPSSRKTSQPKRIKGNHGEEKNSDSDGSSDTTPSSSPRNTIAAPAEKKSKSEHQNANSATCLEECSKLVTIMKEGMESAQKHHTTLYVSMLDVQKEIAQNHANIEKYHNDFVTALEKIEGMLNETSKFAAKVHMRADSESGAMEENLDDASNDEDDGKKLPGKSDEEDADNEHPPGKSHGKDDHTKAESKENKKKEHSQSPRARKNE